MGRVSDNAGQPAKQRGRLIKRETIGPPDCPIIYRWTLLNTRLGKLLLHRFPPNSDDRAQHDHPASFVTIVLAGGYVDTSPRPACPNVQWCAACGESIPDPFCMECEGAGVHKNDVVRDRLRIGSVRLRRAEHRHVTKAGPRGAWTLVLMGPKRRSWGFWTEGRWWPWSEHERRFGFGMRCPEDADE